ncbi:MAG: EAL domain-containing protein, partial [Gallionellaceae bacterium]|nr:EAL domain-containing protein [Gallionellaceae bacterium]
EADKKGASICMATITMAHNLGLHVVAEGVETEAQRNFLVGQGCDYLQGYLFSRPVPAAEATAFLQAHAAGRKS